MQPHRFARADVTTRDLLAKLRWELLGHGTSGAQSKGCRRGPRGRAQRPARASSLRALARTTQMPVNCRKPPIATLHSP
eukprot:15477402-Alexandrium_andersonii.AAC.1